MVLPLDLGLVACLHLLFAPFHSDSVRFVVHMVSVPRDSDQASPADIFMAEPYLLHPIALRKSLPSRALPSEVKTWIDLDDSGCAWICMLLLERFVGSASF